MTPLRQSLEAYASMGIVGARFTLAAGRAYAGALLESPYGRGAPQACYANALALAMEHPALLYVEGYAMGFLPVQHAWCATSDGQVVEATWGKSLARDANYMGVAFQTQFVRDWTRRLGRMSVMAEMFPPELLELAPADYLAGATPVELQGTEQLRLEVLAELSRPKQ